MKQRDIQTKIDVVLDNLEKLKLLQEKPLAEFKADFRNIDSALHRLQTSIQALLDIGSYLIASLGLKTPGTNAQIIEILAEAGHLPQEKLKTYITMSQFRNRIVHLYNHIEVDALHEILTSELSDIRDLYTHLLKVLDSPSR